MDFFIAFEVGYIFSPKCPLSKAKGNALHIHKTARSLLSGIHKKVQNVHFQAKYFADHNLPSGD